MEQFDQVVRLNLTGSVLPSQIFLQPMVQQKKGVILNFSSMAAFRPMTRVVGYAAAKAAVTNFTQYLSTEMATKFGEGIRVNAIAPGFFLTTEQGSVDQPRRILHPKGTGCDPADPVQASGQAGRALLHHPLPGERRLSLCDLNHRHGRWRIQRLCHVM